MLASVITLAVIGLADPPEPKMPPSKEELAAITQRGHDLGGYDTASWHASDAVRTKYPKLEGVGGYIARKTDKGWVAAFGRLDETKAKYLIAYEATETGKPDVYIVQAFDPPKADTGFFPSAARAIETTLKDFTEHFEGEQRPYNVAVLPAEEGQFWVYLFPAPTKPGVWPLGGDVLYLVSKDGTKIDEKRQLHKAIIEKEAPEANKDNKLVSGMHTHVLDDVPQDTDVFHVLTRKPAVPEIIRTERFLFMVDADGGIRFLGRADEVLKK